MPTEALFRDDATLLDGIDLQPCGGTHVASTAEVGELVVRKIEKKGRRNRRIIIAFAAPARAARESTGS